MEIVVPINDLARVMLGYYQGFQRRHRGVFAGKTITIDSCTKIVKALLEEEVTGRLRWVPGAISAETTIAEYFPDYNDPCQRLQTEPTGQVRYCQDSAQLWSEVFAAIQESLCHVLNDVIGSHSWDMWTIRPVTRTSGDVVLEKGMDFRIYEWERLVQEKKLSYSHMVADEFDIDRDESVRTDYEDALHTSAERLAISRESRQLAIVLNNAPEYVQRFERRVTRSNGNITNRARPGEALRLSWVR